MLMSSRFILKSSRLFVSFLVFAFCLSATDSKADEPDRAAPAGSDSTPGKEPGQVRDDNALKMKLVWCPPGFVTMEQVEEIREPVPAAETDDKDPKKEP